MRLFEILKTVDCNKSRFRISAPPPYGYTEKSALGRTDLSTEVKTQLLSVYDTTEWACKGRIEIER